MLEFDTSYSFSQVPYTTNAALDDYAEQIVKDFAPERLTTPGVLDTDSFMEYYLRLTLYYYRICHNRKVQGMTAFNGGVVEVLDEKSGTPFEMPVETGAVIIDPLLLLKRNLNRLRFTMLHEGSHWLIHRKAFASDNPFGPAGIYANQFLAAKEGRGDYLRNQKERNDIECMERQADFLSSAILIPRPALREVYRQYFRSYHEKPRRIIRGNSPMDDFFAKNLPEHVSKIFNVSEKAALIRLEKLTAIVDRRWGYYI
jgi:hypothetical protein